MKIRHELSYTVGIRDGGSKKYWVTFYTQPRWRRLVARAYHRYDMNKVVHWIAHRIERDYGMLSGEGYRRNEAGEMVPFQTEPTMLRMPHCAHQDERCHTLGEKDKSYLATVEVAEADYNAIKAGYKA